MYDPQADGGILEIRLEALVPMRGKVVFSDGKGAGGITIDVAGNGHQFDGFRGSATSAEDGTFEVLAAPNMVYLLVVKDKKWAAEPLTGFALWPNQPIEDLKFKLRPTTRIYGRVTIGPDKKPISGMRITSYQSGADAHNLAGVKLPNPENSRSWVQPMVFYNTTTDADGRFEYFVGPGKFDIRGPKQSDVPKFEITNEREKEFNFHMDRPESGILKGLVLAGNPPRPVSGAKVSGIVRHWGAGRDLKAETNEEGRFEVERELHRTALYVQSKEGKLGAIADIDADTDEVKVELKPVASATGVLVDSVTGETLADREIKYGVQVYTREIDEGAFRTAFGGATTTDAEGRFTLNRLVLGSEYHIDVTLVKNERWRTIGKVKPDKAEAIDLGKLVLRPDFKSPTIDERITAAFASKDAPLKRFQNALRDVKLSRQRVLLLFADPLGPQAKEFLSLRYEDEAVRRALDEFRLIPIDSSQKAAKPLLNKIKQELNGEGATFSLIVVDERRAKDRDDQPQRRHHGFRD